MYEGEEAVEVECHERLRTRGGTLIVTTEEEFGVDMHQNRTNSRSIAPRHLSESFELNRRRNVIVGYIEVDEDVQSHVVGVEGLILDLKGQLEEALELDLLVCSFEFQALMQG